MPRINKTPTAVTFDNGYAIQIRHNRGENQETFWARVGITQSCGSRYESGRDIPAPTAALLHLVYGKKPLATLAKLRGSSVEALKAGK